MVYLPLWKILVSWDDEIPNWMEKSKMFQTTNQYTTYNWGGLTLYRSIDGLEIQKWWVNRQNWF